MDQSTEAMMSADDSAKGQRRYIEVLQEQVASMRLENRELKNKIEVQDKRIKELEIECGNDDESDKKKKIGKRKRKQMQKDQERTFTDVEVWRFFFKFAGFNRFSLVSDEFHENFPKAANQLFGFKSWSDAKATVKDKFPDISMTPPHIYKLVSTGNGKALDLDLRECSRFEQLFAVRLMDRTGLTTDRTALLYGKHPRTIRAWKQKWVKAWGLPAYSAEEDDLDDPYKRKSGTMRPFQSRQMINPVKKKKPPPSSEVGDEDEDDDASVEYKDNQRGNNVAAAAKANPARVPASVVGIPAGIVAAGLNKNSVNAPPAKQTQNLYQHNFGQSTI